MIEIVFLLVFSFCFIVDFDLEDGVKDPVLERHMRDEICVDVWDLKSRVFVM